MWRRGENKSNQYKGRTKMEKFILTSFLLFATVSMTLCQDYPFQVYVRVDGNPVVGATVNLCNGSTVYTGTTSGECGCVAFYAPDGDYCLEGFKGEESDAMNVTLNGSGAWTLNIKSPGGRRCGNCDSDKLRRHHENQ
jgi:hypothetical protein